MTRLSEIEAAFAEHGLVSRGAFHPAPADEVPPLPDGRKTETLVLAGNAGPGMWAVFSNSEWSAADPLDSWSRAVLEPIAARFGGAAIFPVGGPPYVPFLHWAQRAGPVRPSPVRILIHPDYGLWHAYRGAIALPVRLDLPPPEVRPYPCDSCAEKPCLSACPVGAMTADGYDIPACTDYLEGLGKRDCAAVGCNVRRACPVGRTYAYEPPQAAFHMAAFVKAARAK